MPRIRVTPMFRTKPVRSSRRIAQTANWQVNELVIEDHGQDGREPRLRVEVEVLGEGFGHLAAVPAASGRRRARTLK